MSNDRGEPVREELRRAGLQPTPYPSRPYSSSWLSAVIAALLIAAIVAILAGVVILAIP